MSHVSFPAFFQMWADLKGWNVPDFHFLMADWLDQRRTSGKRVGVLRVFRGAAKSTMAAIFEAYEISQNPKYRVLVQSSEDKTARKLSRDTKHVLKKHPLCDGLLPERDVSGDAFWVIGHDDPRNPSMNAQGVLSNVTSGRADKVLFDDVEVPKNIITQDARENLRFRLGEATHILVPTGRKLYIGTPHTHQSLYDELEAEGADCLTIPLFAYNDRDEKAVNLRVKALPWVPDPLDLYVFNGRLLLDPNAYTVKGDRIEFKEPQTGVVDVYGGNIWAERFNREEIAFRRAECRTQNEWDSQYMLRARPLHDIRLDPDKLNLYNDEPLFDMANGEPVCKIGEHRIVSVRSYWDVALGKVKGDVSSFSILFQADTGRLFWHRCAALFGELDAQCLELRKLALMYRLPRITVETNGVGGFVPAVLKKHLAGTGCSVKENQVSTNKQARIVAAIEPPLSGRMLHAHRSVRESGAFQQMKDWVANAEQADDHLDSLAGAVLEHPARIPRPDARLEGTPWRGATGSSYDVDVASSF